MLVTWTRVDNEINYLVDTITFIFINVYITNINCSTFWPYRILLFSVLFQLNNSSKYFVVDCFNDFFWIVGRVVGGEPAQKLWTPFYKMLCLGGQGPSTQKVHFSRILLLWLPFGVPKLLSTFKGFFLCWIFYWTT